MSQTEKDVDQQTNLKMEKAIRSQMETLIPEMQKMADNYNIAGDKSPYRNVLNVAVDPASDVEVTKNYIRYQLGRGQRHGRDTESPWRKTGSDGGKFGLTLVDTISGLDKNAKLVVKDMGKDPNTDSGKFWLERVHRRLMQLYLGHLVRYQVYLTFEKEREKKESEGNN